MLGTRTGKETLPHLKSTDMTPHNPFLAPDTGKVSIHFDCACSDTTPHAAWLGTDEVTPDRVRYLPGNLVNVGYAFKRYPDGSEALLYSGPTSVGKVRVDGGRFDPIDVLVYPGAEASYIPPDDMRRALEKSTGRARTKRRCSRRFASC